MPQGLLDHMAEHAVRFPGSSTAGPGSPGRSIPTLVAVVLGGVGTLIAAGALAWRRLRPSPAAAPVEPVSRPWVA